jgi:putative thioredoxin
MSNFNFQKEVIERSNDVAVVVDFWSPTCGPCLMLKPILEKLASKAEGKWELVKINTMEHNQVAWEQGIQSIPHVKMFSKGKMVSEFVGALPENTLVKWLDEFIPTEAKEKLNAIRERLHGDEHEAAMEDLRSFAKDHPELPMASLILASEIVFTSPMEAMGLVTNIKMGDLLYESAENVRILAELSAFQNKDGSKVGENIEACAKGLATGDFDSGLSSIIEAVTIDKGYARELPRRGAIALMRMMGPQHPLTIKYRRKFEMALY